MDMQSTNLQQLCDAIMSIWTKISEECFQHIVEHLCHEAEVESNELHLLALL